MKQNKTNYSEHADNPILISTRDAMRMLGFGRSTWYRFMASGKTPMPVRVGRAVRWRRDELLAWVEAGCPPRSRWVWNVKNNH